MTNYSQFDRDCASEAIAAIDRRTLVLAAQVPRSILEKGHIALELDQLWVERQEHECVLLGLNPDGTGIVRTTEPGWPDDGFPL